MRRLLPIAAAVCVGAGLVVAAFVFESRPLDHLFRPLAVVTVVAVPIGAAASLTRAPVLVATLVTALVVDPVSPAALGLAAVGCGVIVWHISKGVVADIDTPLATAAAVFLLAGLIPVVPMLSWSTPARAAGDGPPTFLILLDGYPRADTLTELGVDISGFVDELEARGFDHYPDATSHHAWTFRTLTAMTIGEPMAEDDWGVPAVRKEARASWRLPDGFSYIAPPVGMVTFPRVQPLNQVGMTHLEAELLAGSAFGPISGGMVMDGLRAQLDRSLNLLVSTDKPRVFAHLLAPHTPFLYDGDGESLGAPSCWPGCDVFEINAAATGLTVEEWGEGTAGYLEWLNRRLIETIDAVLVRYPEARVVLFSDHGGRFSYNWLEEWHRTFLAARGVDLSSSPQPSAILSAVQNP